MKLSWSHAKTYPDAPHEYVLRDQYPDTFTHYEGRLREEGVDDQFTLRGRTAVYRYFYGGDGYKYWIIGEVLNRCIVASPARNASRGPTTGDEQFPGGEVV